MNVVTLGGNALVSGSGAGTIREQVEVATRAMGGVADLIAAGEPVVLSHGNGPIVGNILIRNDRSINNRQLSSQYPETQAVLFVLQIEPMRQYPNGNELIAISRGVELDQSFVQVLAVCALDNK